MRPILNVTFHLVKLLISIGVFVLSISSFAMNGRTTYQAKIIKPDGQPLEATNVNFKFSTIDGPGSCVLYTETYSAVNMASTGGLISFALGSGIRGFPVASATTAIFANVFDNTITSMPCEAAGIYNPTPIDTRKIVMQFNDGTGWQTLPAMTINAVPYAMYAVKANDAKTLNGKADSVFVEYSTLASLSCAADQAIKFNGVSFSCITVGSGGGGSGINSVTTSGTVLTTGGTASAPVISITAASMSADGYLTSLDYAEFKAKLSASSTQIANTLGFAPVSSTTVATQISTALGGVTSSQVLITVNDTASASSSNVTNAIVKRDSSGNSSFSGISANVASLNYVDIYRPSTAFNIRLQAPTSLAANYTLILPNASGTTGQVLSTDGSGNLSWVNPANGSVISVSATAPLSSTGGAMPTISIDQATSSTSGYLTSTDFNTFNNKQNATSSAIIATLGYTPATSTTLAASFVQKTGDTMTGLLNLPSNGLAVGTNQLVVSSSNVGIGVVNPTAFLEIKAGTTSFAPLRLASGALLSSAQSGTIEYDGSQLYFTDGTNTRRALASNSGIQTNSADNTFSGTNTFTGLTYISNNTASINSTTGALVVSGGVGVAGNIYSSGTIITSSNIQGSSITATSGVNTNVVQGNMNLLLNPNGGNVGIGTSSPVTSLHILSRQSSSTVFPNRAGLIVEAEGSDVGGRIVAQVYSDTEVPYFHAYRARGSKSVPTALQTNDLVGAFSTVGYSGAAWHTAAHIRMVATENWNPSAIGSALIFNTSTNSSTTTAERMRINHNGNVGIGTTTPGSRQLIVNSSLSTNDVGIESNMARTSGTNYSIRANAYGAGADTNIALYGNAYSGTNNFALLTHDGNVALAANSGNVGIGTSSPTRKLHIHESSGGPAYLQLSASSTGTGTFDGLQIAIDGATSDAGVIQRENSLLYLSTNNTPRLNITGDGNVGIGTTIPTAKFEVVTSQSEVPSTVYNSIAGTLLKISGRELAIGTADTPPYATYFQSRRTDNSANDISLNPSGGSVGIGTVAPQVALEVSGAIRVPGVGQIGPSGGYGYAVFQAGTNNFAGQMYGTVSGVQFTDNLGGNTVFIKNGGNVGIGTVTPNAKLEVSGNIKASGTYINVLNLDNYTATVNGLKIKTNIPFLSDEMPTVIIEGFDYRAGRSIGLILNWYGYAAGSAIIQHSVASFGGQTPAIQLSNEAGKVIIHIGRDKSDQYYNKLSIRVLDTMKPASYYSGWTWADEAVSGTSTVTVPYINRVGNLYADASVGIGTAAPETALHVAKNILTQNAVSGSSLAWTTNSQFKISSGNNALAFSVVGINNQRLGVIQSGHAGDGLNYYPDLTDPKLALQPYGGNVGIGTTSPGFKLDVLSSADTVARFKSTAGDPYLTIFEVNSGNTGCAGNMSCSEFAVFQVAGVAVGSITPNPGGTATQYNTTSDVRLKENVKAILEPLKRLRQIQVSEYNYIKAPDHKIEGLIAQQLKPIVPYAVSGEEIPLQEDDQNSDGLPDHPLQVDYSKLVPIVVAAVQELDKKAIHKDSNGNAGIGTTAPSQKLHVVGDARIQGTVTDCYIGNGSGGTSCSSDARLKENIKPIPYALEKVITLKGVEFDWNHLSQSHGRHDIGVIAQDVEKVFPTAVVTGDDGYKKVDYAVLVAPLIQAFKQFYKLVLDRFEGHDRQIASIVESKADKAEIEVLKSENAAKSKEINALKAYLCSKDPTAAICK